MTLNEKTFQQIMSFHKKGLGEDGSLLGILQLMYGHADHRGAARWIKRFYRESGIAPLQNVTKGNGE